jgi:hypothetical protein
MAMGYTLGKAAKAPGYRAWRAARREWARETITHRHPSLPFILITQERYAAGRGGGDNLFEDWSFEIRGPKEPDGYPVAYDGVAYMRAGRSEAQMIENMCCRAEKHFLDDRGPFFVLRIYLETGQYRKQMDALMTKYGQSPLWRRAEAAIARSLGLQRSAIRMRYRPRDEKESF